MASMQEFQARLRAAVRETVKKVVAEGALPEGADGASLFTVLEDLALAAGDAVSLEVFEQNLALLAAGEQPADCCPQCGGIGQQVKKRMPQVQLPPRTATLVKCQRRRLR